MKIKFLDSGIDSLKKGFENLLEYENRQFNADSKASENKRFFFLKDAILFIQHGIEILIKQIIHEHSEYLLFSQIDDNVKKALKEKNDRKLKSVFESELKHKLHTVTFLESLERIKIIPNVKFPIILEEKIKKLETYRNIIMHSEPHLNEIEINSTFDGLANELDNFFYDTIGKGYKTISGYSEFVSNFEAFQRILKEKNAVQKVNANEVLLAALKHAKVSIGINEVKRITNVNTCNTFLTKIFDSELKFGTDLYNGYCSGDVRSIKRTSENSFSMYTADNDCFFDFSLKSIILFVPQIHTDSSPIIFIESDEVVEDDLFPLRGEMREWNEIRSLSYKRHKSNKCLIIDPEDLARFYEHDEFDREDYEDHERFYTKGLFCFFNIQGLEYNRNYKTIIWQHKLMDGKHFEIVLREAVKKGID